MSPTSGSRRSEQSRQAILHAAHELCGEVGYGGLRIEAIARRAGVGKQTIYRWWSSKGQLLLEALEHAARDTAWFPDRGDLIGDLVTQMRTVALFMSDEEGRGPGYWGVLAAAREDSEFGRCFRSSYVARRREQCIERLQRGIEDLDLPANTDLELLVDQLYGALYYRFVVSREPIDEQFVEQHVTSILGAYRCLARGSATE